MVVSVLTADRQPRRRWIAVIHPSHLKRLSLISSSIWDTLHSVAPVVSHIVLHSQIDPLLFELFLIWQASFLEAERSIVSAIPLEIQNLAALS